MITSNLIDKLLKNKDLEKHLVWEQDICTDKEGTEPDGHMYFLGAVYGEMRSTLCGGHCP